MRDPLEAHRPRRRSSRALRVLSTTLWTLAATFALATPSVAETLEAGVFLVAKPSMSDPRFQRTVILIVRHARETGALGLIVNRPTALVLSEAVPSIEAERARRQTVFLGGPVELERMSLLYRHPGPPGPETAHRVLADVYYSVDRRVLDAALVASEGVLKVFTGYAGWAPGQLESELERGDWYLTPADPDRVFSDDPDRLWPELDQRRQRGMIVFED